MVIERDLHWFDKHKPTRAYSKVDISHDPEQFQPFTVPYRPVGRDWEVHHPTYIYMDDETGLLVSDRERFEKWIEGIKNA